MNSNYNTRLKLGVHLGMDAVRPAIIENASGGYEISGFSMMVAGLWVFQQGAFLGRARADRIEVLAKLVAIEGGEKKMCEFFKSSSARLLADHGREPRSFMDLWLKYRFPSVDLRELDILVTLHHKKHHLGEMLPQFQVAAAFGIGFGAMYPELVKKMWINSYETDRDKEIWKKARKSGLNIPEKRHLPLKEMEELVLRSVTDFAREHHPRLINSLDLQLVA
jgi:hypothetical protein